MTYLLIDLNSLVHRAYHSAGKNGKPVGKFIGYLWDLFSDTLPRHGLQPTHAAAIFDPPGRNWRHEIFPQYKIHRHSKPSLIGPHMSDCLDACWCFGLKTLTKTGYEADDLIATYARMACENDHVVIVSQDKDLMQLIRDNVWLLDHRTGRIIRSGDVYAKFGVNPDRLHDLLALSGDVADGIPGVEGIGTKGAAELLLEYRSLHHLLLNANRVLRKSHRNALLRQGDRACLAYRLIELRDVRPHIPAKLHELIWPGIDMTELLKAMYGHGLKALAERICHSTGRDAA